MDLVGSSRATRRRRNSQLLETQGRRAIPRAGQLITLPVKGAHAVTNQLPIPPDEVYAVPGENHIIDMIHPVTGLTIYGGRDEASVKETYPGAVRMPYETWRAEAIASQDTPIVWQTTDEKSYIDMLEVLPPALWIGGAFLVGEPCDHSYATGAPRFQGFWHRGTEYLCSNRPITRAELRAALAPTSARLALEADAAPQVPS